MIIKKKKKTNQNILKVYKFLEMLTVKDKPVLNWLYNQTDSVTNFNDNIPIIITDSPLIYL